MNYLSPLTTVSAEHAAADHRALGDNYEARMISSGLFALTDRPSNKVRTAIVRTSPTTLILVAASKTGYGGGLQQVELQLHLSNDGRTEDDSGYRLPVPTMFVSNHAGGNLRRFEITRDLALWAMRGAVARAGDAEASRLGLAELDVTGRRMAADVREFPDDDRGLFLERGLEGLAADVARATLIRERFAPAPRHQPLLLGRSRAWSPADYTVPSGTIVEDALDLPADAVFTAVWYDSYDLGYDVSDGRGVSPLLRLIDSPEVNGMAITAAEPTGSSTWRQWAPQDVSQRTLYGWRYVIHTGTGPTVRELGGSRFFSGFITVDKTEKHHFKNPVTLPNSAADGYTGPLPGEPHRRIQRLSDGYFTIVELDVELDGEWYQFSYRAMQHSDAVDDDVRKAAESLLRGNDLCWADIDDAEIKILDSRTPDSGVGEDTKPPLRRSRFLQWVRRLAKQSRQTGQPSGGVDTPPLHTNRSAS